MERVVLAWAHPGVVSGRFMDSVLRSVLAGNRAVEQGVVETNPIAGYIYIESGPRIGSARNNLVRQFLASEHYRDVEWLLMLDSDIVFSEQSLPMIFDQVRTEQGSVTKPLVGGLYIGGGHAGMFPVMYRLVDPETNGGNVVETVRDWKPGEMVEVDATGAGFLLMHRGLLEEMALRYPEPAPWFAESVYKGMELGEDWTFCIRARTMGVPIYVNTSLNLGHVKLQILDEAAWRESASEVPKAVELWTPAPPMMNREQRRAAARATR